MKQRLLLLLKSTLLAILLCSACQNNKTPHELEPIKVGEQDLTEVSLNKQTTHTIILQGGTGKYIANVESSKIAGVSISRDTLRITGHLEGETFATILSGDYRRKLPIHVVVPAVSVNMEEVRLYPTDESRFISLQGGGDKAKLVIDDPEEAISARWNAKTSILEVDAHHEGVAVVHLISEDGSQKSVTITVRCSGTDQGVGLYGTTSRSLYLMMRTGMTLKRGNRSFTIFNAAQPYQAERVVTLSPIPTAPHVGETVKLQISLNNPQEFRHTKVREGSHSLIVEQVDATKQLVTLRGKGFKVIMPYIK